jgi:hypothetical protein
MTKFHKLICALVCFIIIMFGCAAMLSTVPAPDMRDFVALDGSNKVLFQYPVPPNTPDLGGSEFDKAGQIVWISSDSKAVIVFVQFKREVQDKGITAVENYILAVLVNGRPKVAEHTPIAISHNLLIPGRQPLSAFWMIKGKTLVKSCLEEIVPFLEKLTEELESVECKG